MVALQLLSELARDKIPGTSAIRPIRTDPDRAARPAARRSASAAKASPRSARFREPSTTSWVRSRFDLDRLRGRPEGKDARQGIGDDGKVVAVIGDGALDRRASRSRPSTRRAASPDPDGRFCSTTMACRSRQNVGAAVRYSRWVVPEARPPSMPRRGRGSLRPCRAASATGSKGSAGTQVGDQGVLGPACSGRTRLGLHGRDRRAH